MASERDRMLAEESDDKAYSKARARLQEQQSALKINEDHEDNEEREREKVGEEAEQLRLRQAPAESRQQRRQKFSSARLEDRRSTLCSSVGAYTCELNYDSSISSGPNCFECPMGAQKQAAAAAETAAAPATMFQRSQSREMMMTTTSTMSNRTASQVLLESGGGGGIAGCEHNQERDYDQVGRACNQCKGAKKHSLIQLHASCKPIKKREHWDKNIEFLLAVIGFAVDLGNVWRFPYICYKNGGGAFLVPYTIMFILGGLPIFYLEMSLGQYFSSGCLTVWRRVCPLAKGIGYAMCMLNFFTGLFYNTVISWAVFFFVESFAYQLPWTSCNNNWNSAQCRTIEQRHRELSLVPQEREPRLQPPINQSLYSPSPTKEYFEREVLRLHLSNGIDDLGSIRTPLAIYLAIVFLCIYFAIWKGVKSTGKAVWITALLPYFVLLPLLVRGVFLEGSSSGIKYYLYPDWAKIFDVDVWVEAAKQIYFSLGPGFGTLLALSSYNKFNHNCRRDALIAASVNYFASFIAGLVIFAVLGYMAHIEKVSIADVATEGPGLVFQVYPEGLATMRYSALWSVLFFMMVISLGIDSTFGGLESVITGLCDEYPRTLRAHRGIFIGLLIIVIYLCSLPTTTYGGNYVILLLEAYGTSLSLLFIVLVETIVVCWIYGVDRFCKNLEEMYGSRPGAYWRICWKYISPTILVLIFIAACFQEWDKYQMLTSGDYVYPSWAPTLGLLMTGSSVCCVPIYAIYYFRTQTQGTIWQRWQMAIRPIDSEQDKQKRAADGIEGETRHQNARYTSPMASDKIRDLDTDI